MEIKIFFKAIARTLFIVINNLYSIPAFVVWTFLLLPIKLCNPQYYWFIEGHMFHWLLYMVSNWMWSAGYMVAEVGDDLTPYYNEECLVVSNHQSTGDVPVLMNCMSNKPGVHNNVMWIMDILFKYTNFGWVSQVHQDFFITQGKETRNQQLKDLKEHLMTAYCKKKSKWLVLFPEGGFLRKRRVNSKRYGEKHGYPALHHVTLPRTGAMEVILNTLADKGGPKQNGFIENHGSKDHPKDSKLKWLIDVTIGYPDAKPLDVFCILFGHRYPCKTTVLYRVYSLNNIPHEGNKLLMWLFERWEEKEQLLDEFYKTGSFPSLCENENDSIKKETVVQLNMFRLVCYHLFYIASTGIQLYMVKNLLSIVGFI